MLIKLLKDKRGVALELAIVTTLTIMALCLIIVAVGLMSNKRNTTNNNYIMTSAILEQIGEDFVYECSQGRDPLEFAKEINEKYKKDTRPYYECYVSGSSTYHYNLILTYYYIKEETINGETVESEKQQKVLEVTYDMQNKKVIKWYFDSPLDIDLGDLDDYIDDEE